MDFWDNGHYGDIDASQDYFDNASDPQDGFVDMGAQHMNESGFTGLSVQDFGMALGLAEEIAVDYEQSPDEAFNNACEDLEIDETLPVSLRTHSASAESSMAFHKWALDVAQGRKTVNDPL